MKRFSNLVLKFAVVGIFLLATSGYAQKKLSNRQIEKIKKETLQKVDDQHKNTQVMVDKIFSFAELGFQEYESSAYLTAVLEKAGFTIEHGISGIPTAWMARWENGEGPVIALGSDVDFITSQWLKGPLVMEKDTTLEFLLLLRQHFQFKSK